MRKRFKAIFLWLSGGGILVVALAFILNLPVETRQGVDYVVQVKRIPLSLKLVDFYDRHLQYKTLVKEIVTGAEQEEEKILALFWWVHKNINAGTPPGLRVMDDHPWNIIVRGYGEPDQLSDVLVTLCSYLGVPAYFFMVRGESAGGTFAFTAVSVNGKWRLLDPFFGVVFRNHQGELATLEEARRDPAVLAAVHPQPTYRGVPYADFVHSQQVVMASQRGQFQRPWSRLKLFWHRVF